MASNVWVLYTTKSGEDFIRGSEITAVRVSTSSVHSYGKKIETSTVELSHPGTEYRSVDDLWEFPSRSAADEAVQVLLGALAADPCGVVARDNDGKVRVRPLPVGSE